MRLSSMVVAREFAPLSPTATMAMRILPTTANPTFGMCFLIPSLLCLLSFGDCNVVVDAVGNGF